MNRLHYFNDSLKHGKEGEEFLNNYFASLGYSVRPASREEDRGRHIDAWITPRKGGPEISLQYKTDTEAIRTGNCFIEHISVDAPNIKPGWVHTTEAAKLVYYIPEQVIYIASMEEIRSHFVIWSTQHRLKRGWSQNRDRQNRDYFTGGILVPRPLFETAVTKIVRLSAQQERRAA